MKHIFTFLFLLAIVSSVISQRTIWQSDFQTDTVNVRTDTAYVMHKVTVDIPAKGMAVVRMEGTVSGSKGDVITLGVSNTNDWESNFGNVSIRISDSMYHQQQYTHTMAYPVEEGSQDFYAVMHNWTDRYGSGYASATGSMIIEFIPDSPNGATAPYTRFNKYPFIVPDVATPFDSLTVMVENESTYFVSAFLKVYSSNNQEMEVILQYQDDAGLHTSVIPTPIVHSNDYPSFVISEFAHFSPGEHKIYFLARKKSGDFTSGNNAFYGTAYAVPQVQNDETLPYFFESFSKTIPAEGQYFDIFTKNWEMPLDGKLYLMTDGHWNGSLGDNMELNLQWDNAPEGSYSTQSFSIDQTDSKTHFTANRVLEVTQGQTIPIALQVKFNGKQSSTGFTTISGNCKAYLISEPVISSSEEITKAPQHWQLYPNPGNDFLTLSHDLKLGQTFSIVMVDVAGRVAYRKNNINSSTESIDVSSFTPGIYSLVITAEQITTMIKVTVFP